MSEAIAQLKTCKAQVLYLLEKYPDTRNNDFFLQYMWMKVFSSLPLPFIPYSEFRSLGSHTLNVLYRVRAKIQNEERRFLPTDPEVLRHRKLREADFRSAINREPW